jgi:L-ascorbate metabolism protein UlaG (beta-lactamase superfamily)
MKQINAFYDIDFAILPIGGTFTMDIEAALDAAAYVGTNTIIGMHYDTFEDIKIDHQKVRPLAEKNGQKLLLMDIGQLIEC